MYKTNSLPLASYLYSKKELEFAGLNTTDPNKILFLFKPDKKATKLADDFFLGKDGANELFKNYHTLKEMVFNVKKNLPTPSQQPSDPYARDHYKR